tara:strand:+ start:1260 stop:1769 length:510 start_codon:yes stop_codon:yes gene_type:complete
MYSVLNVMNVDIMIVLYVIGLFLLVVVCVYALIQSKANRLYTFIIIPTALLMSLYSWQAITALQGMPIYGLPYNKEVQLLYAYDEKPWIYLLLSEPTKYVGPKLYKIDWSKENLQKVKELTGADGKSQPQGKFKKGLNGEAMSFIMSNIDDNGQSILKEVPKPRNIVIN